LCLALLAWQSARAETPQVLTDELREFEVSVQDKSVGTNQIRITETDDGATAVALDVAVKCDFFVYVYRYELHGKETWQGDQLVAVDNRAVDNGTRLIVRAKVDGEGSRIDTGGKAPAKGPVLQMTTNFWRSPPAKNGPLSFIDVDKGTVVSATSEQLGAEQVIVGSEKVSCTHYRLRGDVNADLWFDGRGRLVRQRTVEMGLPTELRLVRVTAKGGAIARR
jgi:hypothetical protein